MSRKNKRKDIAVGKKTRLKPREWLLLFGAVATYFFYMKSKDVLLNDPSWLTRSIFVCVFMIAFVAGRRHFLDVQPRSDKIDQAIYWSFSIIKVCIFSWFMTGIALIPFNYYNIYTSRNQPVERVACEITGISTHSGNRSVFYTLYDDTNITYGYKPIMEEIREGARYDDYYFIAYVRKGLLRSYLLEDWDIQKR